MKTQRIALAVVPFALAVAVAGCSGSDDPSDGAASDPASGSSSAAGAIDFPDEGVDLVDLPDLEGAYLQAFETYVEFERGRRWAARTGDVTTCSCSTPSPA